MIINLKMTKEVTYSGFTQNQFVIGNSELLEVS